MSDEAQPPTQQGGDIEQPDDVSSGAAVTSATTLPGAILFIHLTDKQNPNTKYSVIAYDDSFTPNKKGSEIIADWDSKLPYYEYFTKPETGQDKRAKFARGSGEYYFGVYGQDKGTASIDWPFKSGNSKIKNGFFMAFWNQNTEGGSGIFTNAVDAKFGSTVVPVIGLQQGLPNKNLIKNNAQLKELNIVCYAMANGSLNLAQ